VLTHKPQYTETVRRARAVGRRAAPPRGRFTSPGKIQGTTQATNTPRSPAKAGLEHTHTAPGGSRGLSTWYAMPHPRQDPCSRLAGFWPDKDEQYRSTLRTNERHLARSDGICPGRRSSRR
jgi:hypothetical protein